MSGRGRASALDRVINDAVNNHRIVGAEVIAARHGEIVYQRAAGYADRESRRAVQPNEIFRLASMTKAIVSVAALALADQGAIHLDDPVTRWLPTFRPRLADGREAVITVRHLMTHTAGLGYGFLEPQDGPYHRLGVSDGLDSTGLTLEDPEGGLAVVVLTNTAVAGMVGAFPSALQWAAYAT